jgi:predicted HNH restriction endonuclease
MDFRAETGEVFKGGEITHSQRVHAAVSQSDSLISFTVTSTGMKRYALVKDYGVKGALMRKIKNNKDMSTEEIASDIAEVGNLNNIDDILRTLASNIPPGRIEQVVKKVVRSPKIARLIKERSKYICEICGRKPFIQSNGRLYAEADHIRPLGGSTRGLDTPENMRCLCAQCHAIVTCGSDEAVEELLNSDIKQFS